MWSATPICFKLLIHCVRRADSRAAGKSKVMRIAMIVITTSSSTSVKPCCWFRFMTGFPSRVDCYISHNFTANDQYAKRFPLNMIGNTSCTVATRSQREESGDMSTPSRIRPKSRVKNTFARTDKSYLCFYRDSETNTTRLKLFIAFLVLARCGIMMADDQLQGCLLYTSPSPRD